MERIVLTDHVRKRMCARRIPWEAVETALLFGRKLHVKGATFYVIGSREVARYRDTERGIERFEGIQVVCAKDGAVMTAYRNRDFSGLRPGRLRRKVRKHGRVQGHVWVQGVAA